MGVRAAPRVSSRRWWKAAALTVLASAAVLQIAGSAQAGHYHNVNNIQHGLVHGSSDSDGAFFSRTYGYYFGSYNFCGVGDYDAGYYATAYSYNADLCSLYSYTYYRAPDECRGVSYNRVQNQNGGADFLGEHLHDAHSPPQYSCRVSAA